jgi:energy-coupling factor transport system ATP-binding protein
MNSSIQIKNLELKSGYLISNLSIPPSHSFAIIGRSGSGKTEFCLKLLEHLYIESVQIDQIAYVPTDPYLLFSGIKSTLRGEIELSSQFLGKSITPVYEIAESFQIEHLLDRDVFTLSGGEAVKAALAIVAAKKPKIWILDQIFDWLHPITRNSMRELICRNAISEFTIIETHSIIPKWINELDSCAFLDLNKEVKIGKYRDISSELNDKFLLGANYELDDSYERNKSEDDIFPARIDNAQVQALLTQHNSLKVENLTFKYSKTGFSISSTNFSAHSGDIIALLGSNGAGKTTLLKNLALVLEPHSGNVLINGQAARKKPYERPQEILYCFQNPDDQLFLPTVRDELLTTLKQICNNKNLMDLELLERFNLLDKQDDDPFILPRPYKRMIPLAAGFLACPPIILFDEPTAGLDGFQKTQLARELKEYASRGGICILVSHDYDFVDYIATIRFGLELGELVTTQL